MDRREAMLREMNLYPLWVRRDLPAPQAAEVEAPAPVERVAAVEAAAALPQTYEAVPAPAAVNEVTADSAMHEEAGSAEAVTEEAGDETVPPDLFAAPHDEDDWTGMTFREHGEGEDTLRAFQRKVAAGPLAGVDWPELKQKVHDCQLCALRAGCTQTVFGVGDEQADWLFVGEGPGEEEDAEGEPFVGESGRLLDNMLIAIGLRRNANAYITNVVKCRPPENRPPHLGEIAACLPYLKRQIGLLKPRLIVVMGKTAATALLDSDATLATLRGRVYDYAGIPLIVTYHPAYLLRKPTEKARVWEDLRLAVETINALPGQGNTDLFVIPA